LNRILPILALLLFGAWFVGQFGTRAARPAPAPSGNEGGAAVGSVEVRVAAPKREPPVVLAARPEEIRGALLAIDELALSGDLEEAVGRLETLLSGEPPRDVKAASLIELARLHMVRRDFRAARALYEKFLREFPGHAQRGNVERAIEFMAGFETHRAEFRPIEEELRAR